MSAIAIKSNRTKREKVMMKVTRNTKDSKRSIMINTLIPNFEYKNAQNHLVKPNSLLKI